MTVRCMRSDIDLPSPRASSSRFIGPSGCGKTTLLRVSSPIWKADRRTMSVNGMTPDEARLARAYGYVFQAGGALSLAHHRRQHRPAAGDHGALQGRARQRIKSNLELVNLPVSRRSSPGSCPGGMQQRASIARALAVEPDMLLMDEPFGALDEIVRDHLNEQLLKLWAKTKKTVVFVTHSIPEAVFLSTKIVVMSPRPGRIYDDHRLQRAGRGTVARCPRNAGVPEDRPQVREGLKAGHSYDD
jgi:NitT/TauT family transport system ATP-binding protein